MRKFLSVGLLIAILTGCAGYDYVKKNYNGVPVTQYKNKDDTWKILDKPNEGKLLVVQSVGAGAGATLMGGLGPLGALANTPKPLFQEAASGFLKSTDRECTIKDSYMVIQTRWEFVYTCKKK